MRLIKPALLMALLMFSFVPPRAAQADAVCQLGIDADFPVTYVDGHIPVVTVKISGQDVKMMVDSGSGLSFLSTRAYNRLHLNQTDNAPGWSATGLGGTMKISAFALVNIDLGAVKLTDQVVGIFVKSTQDETGQNAIDGVMGYDILQYFDIGLDLPHNRITFYTPQHCTVTETPWPGSYAPTPFTRPRAEAPVIPEAIDGQNFNVAIDSGSDRSMIMQDSLTRHSVTPEATPVAPGGTATGTAGLKFNVMKAQFSTLDIGAEEFDNAWLMLDTTKAADLNGMEDGTLGEDYLATHRVFIVNSDNTAYLGLSGQ